MKMYLHKGGLVEEMFIFDSEIYITYRVLKNGLRTPNEDINQIYLKNWADVADKICFNST